MVTFKVFTNFVGLKLKGMVKKLIEQISTNYINRYWVLAIDVFASILATFIVFWGMRAFLGRTILTTDYLILIVLSTAASLTAFLIFKTYRGILRHTTMREMWRVSIASIVKSFLLLALIFVSEKSGLFNTPFTHLFIAIILDMVLTLFILIMIRVLLTNVYALMLSNNSDKKSVKRVLIYGDNDDSVSVLSMIEKSTIAQFKMIGFISKEDRNSKQLICGYSVYLADDKKSFNKLVNLNNIQGIIFPNHLIAKKEKEDLVAWAWEKKIQIYVKPNLSELNGDDSIVTPIREIKIEDLLGREEVNVNMGKISGFINDKVVLVTGGAGSIGSELCRNLVAFNVKKLVIVDTAETPMHDLQLELDRKINDIDIRYIIADVRSRHRMDSLFNKFRPDIVFHAAAYKHVPMMEKNPCEAINVNVFGTRNIADYCVKYKVEKMIMISTDKAVNPTNVMGASKRIAEIYVQTLGKAIDNGVVEGETKFVTTRFGNVLGSNGSVIPLFREQIRKGGPVTVTAPNIIRYFMTIPEACKLVLEAATMGNGSEIYVFDMGEPVKIVTLARNMISLAGLEPDVDIEIEYTGLRPGEKMFEELLNNEENTIPTHHDKIFKAKVREYEYNAMMSQLTLLYDKAINIKKTETVKLMKEIVPEFKSENSEFEKLDK